jgi:hypothetical protein
LKLLNAKSVETNFKNQISIRQFFLLSVKLLQTGILKPWSHPPGHLPWRAVKRDEQGAAAASPSRTPRWNDSLESD